MMVQLANKKKKSERMFALEGLSLPQTTTL
jgi:hypothetical protein